MKAQSSRDSAVGSSRDAAVAIAQQLRASRESATPLYMQLAAAIRNMIDQGVVASGEALPSERELTSVLKYSRVTVRQAIDHLSREGLLSRRQGAGTFVSRHIHQPLSVLTGFTADMRRRGAESGSILLEKKLDEPSSDEMLILGLGSNERVMRLSRVRTTSGEPLAIEHAVVPAAILRPDMVDASLYAAFRQAGFMPVRALQRLYAANATPQEASHLKIAVGIAILHIERRSFLANGAPIEVTRSVYRGDRYDFIAELRTFDGLDVPGEM